MLKLLAKIFLSSGAVLGTFAATGHLPNQKKGNTFFVLDKPENKVELGEIRTIEDIEIFEKNNNCSFSFVHRWDSQEAYNIKGFLEQNKSQADKEKYVEKALKKVNELKEKCKQNGVVALFYWYENFDLQGNLSEG